LKWIGASLRPFLDWISIHFYETKSWAFGWIPNPQKVRTKALHRIAQTRNYIFFLASKFGEDSEDKAIARLGVNYGVLRRLGFREDRVEECLRTTHGMDLEDMFDWVNNAILAFFILKFTCFSAIPAFS
jgi:hypothetical protein